MDWFRAFYRRDAIAEGLYDHLRYPVDERGVPTADSKTMGEWHPIHCLDENPQDLTPDEERIIFPLGRRDASGKPIAPRLELNRVAQLSHDPSVGFVAPTSGLRQQCGYYTFVEASEIPVRTQMALEHVNQLLQKWGSGDPVRIVARMEQWLIGIHPFKDGNGRTVRLLGDFLLTSLGLPPPIYWSTWNDMSYPEEKWADQIAEGLARTQEILEACADYLEGKTPSASFSAPWEEYCTPVPLTPTTRPW